MALLSFKTLKNFLDKVDMRYPGKCYPWTSAKNRKGYGKFRYKNKDWTAHRVSYEVFVGEIHSGLFVLHKCDNPPCVNPAHLFLGTQLDNMRDMIAKGRKVRVGGLKVFCKRGHRFDKENTRIYGGARFCRKCDSIRHKEYWIRKKTRKQGAVS